MSLLKYFTPKNVQILPSHHVWKHLNKDDIAEIAFIGRGNVGKSTVLNALIGSTKLVSTSTKPGHTRRIQFIQIGNILRVVDTPGYGHKSHVEWGKRVMEYMNTTKNLKRVMVLLDIRRSTIKDTDVQAIQLLQDIEAPFQIVCTKADKVNPHDIHKQVQKITQDVQLKTRVALPFETLVTGIPRRHSTKMGIQQLRMACLACLTETRGVSVTSRVNHK